MDFVLSQSSSSDAITLLEVKNVVGADYPLGQVNKFVTVWVGELNVDKSSFIYILHKVPSGRSPIGVYETAITNERPYQRAAIFPHGSHKVVIYFVIF